MSQNMLVDRLKAAKRELTALKTAHKRGLGLCKVYTETYRIPKPSGSNMFYWLTINISFGISSYPFVQEYLVIDEPSVASIATQSEFEYKDNGFSVEFRKAIANLDMTYVVMVCSTSPIVSMSYSWSEVTQ